MKGKTVVVTGGAGFIGSNLVRELFSENLVKIVDDISTGNLDNIKDIINEPNVRFLKGSITDLKFLNNNFKNVDYVFHQAAIPSVPRSVKDPIKSNYANVNGTLNVLVAARDNHVKKVVYASSSSAYGDTPVLPKKEDMKPQPLSPYAVSKLVGEYYCNVFNEVYNLPTIALRYFNVFGPRQDPTSDYAAVVPRFITRLLKGKSPVIYGDGNQTRDFTFVKDTVNANILAIESDACGVFNIAGGRCISINELSSIIMEIIDIDIDVIHENSRPGDVRDSLADITKASEEFGYKPTYNLKKGLNETVEWFKI